MFVAQNFNPTSLRKILAIEVNRLGDAINAIPALKTFRWNFPETEIIFLVRKSYVPLFSNFKCIDRVIGWSESSSLMHFIKSGMHLRKENFTLVCSLSPTWRNAILASLSSTKYTVGYLRLGRRIPNFLKTSRVTSRGFKLVKREQFNNHNISETGLKVCAAMGLQPFQTSVEIAKDELPSRGANDVLKKIGISGEYIVIHPFAGWKYRTWSEVHMVNLIKRILSDLHYYIVLIGSRSEHLKLQQIIHKVGGDSRVVSCAGEQLDIVALLIRDSAIFIGMDSGLLHLSTAVKTPSVGIFGPAPPEYVAPQSGQNIYLYRKVECSPCYQRNCIRPHNPCTDIITPDDVYNSIIKILLLQYNVSTIK